MSRVLSLRLKDEQMDRLQRAARGLGRSPSEAAALLLEESLRRAEHPFIEFRNSPAGRQAYLQGTRLAVWQVASLARQYADDAVQTAAYLDIPEVQARSALAYARVYPEEIGAAIADNAWAAEHLLPLTPGFRSVVIDATAP